MNGLRWTTALACLALTAQTPSADDGMAAAFRAMREGHYLAARDAFAGLAFGPDGKMRDERAYQMWQQYSPMVTNELPLDALTRREKTYPPEAAWAEQVRRATARDAIAEIVRRARLTSIVILNESHSSPRDRAFAFAVAKALRPFGYTTLAGEAFANNPGKGQRPAAEQLAADGFVRRNTGSYTMDPVFAGYVREAMALGYRPIAYEMTDAQRVKGDDVAKQIVAREDAQVANLMAAVFTAAPGAKVLIHVGHSHVAEAPIARGDDRIEWMAARLKKATGIDPLTIDQTQLTDLSPDARDAYPVAAAKVGRRDGILFDGDRPLVLGQYAGAVDVQVVHPARRYRHGRPTWLAALGGKPVAVPKTLLPTTGERLVQAFAADAPADAVPLDQVLVAAGQPAPYLMLPTTKVRFATQP